MAKISKLSNTDILRDLKNNQIMSSIQGDFKSFRLNKKKLASLAIADFDAFKSAKAMQLTNIPLFSSTGLKILKVYFMNLFTPKTKDERFLKKLLQKEKSEEKALQAAKKYSRK